MAETFMSTLDDASRAQLHATGTERRFPAKSFIFHYGDYSTSVCIIKEGLLRVDRTTPSGQVTLLDLAIPGDIVGEVSIIDDTPRSASLSTITPMVALIIPATHFIDLMTANPRLHLAVTKRLAHRLRALSSQFLENATQDASARMAGRLLRLVEIEQSLGGLPAELSGEVDLKLPISQEDLAQWSGLAREGAVKGLATLRSVGLIETGRMRVRITDIDRLRTWQR